MRLRYTKRAASQIDAALSYVQERSPQAPIPYAAGCSPSWLLCSNSHTQGIRRAAPVSRITVVPHPYLIDCRVTDDEVIGQRFRHAARRP